MSAAAASPGALAGWAREIEPARLTVMLPRERALGVPGRRTGPIG